MPNKKLHRILAFGDLHAPFHSTPAWNLFLQVAKSFRPDTLISMGDFCDMYSVSRHQKNPNRARQLPEELKVANALLDQLDALKISRKIFIGGNHESRLERYLEEKAPELFDTVQLKKLLHLKRRGWEEVPYKDHIRIGKVYFTHDVGNVGRQAGLKALDAFNHSVVTGHSHRFNMVVEGNAVQEYRVSLQFGWLGDVSKIDYMHRAKANTDCALGFGIGHLDPATGIIYFTPVAIVPHKKGLSCVVEGKLYTG